MEAWRIVQSKHTAGAFSGEGAAIYGGRWNPASVRIVYAAQSLSLAALELLVHFQQASLLRNYSAIRITFDALLVEDLGKPPKDWRKHPPTSHTQEIGAEWAAQARSAVLAVPSAVIPQEINYLINPLHPDFSKIKIGKPEPFAFDPRL